MINTKFINVVHTSGLDILPLAERTGVSPDSILRTKLGERRWFSGKDTQSLTTALKATVEDLGLVARRKTTAKRVVRRVRVAKKAAKKAARRVQVAQKAAVQVPAAPAVQVAQPVEVVAAPAPVQKQPQQVEVQPAVVVPQQEVTEAVPQN